MKKTRLITVIIAFILLALAAFAENPISAVLVFVCIMGLIIVNILDYE